jgi:hypothetical protein
VVAAVPIYKLVVVATTPIILEEGGVVVIASPLNHELIGRSVKS